MLLEIDDWRSVSDLQYRFNKCFPNLHLQVFDAVKKEELPLSGEYHLEQVRRKHEPGVFNIKSWFTASEVAHQLKQEFGLNVRVVLLDSQTEVWRPSFNSMTLLALNNLGVNRHAQLKKEEQEELGGW
ncbi:hypothetical protein SAMN05444008_104113 [Cnuella takakiae]|uniref:Uncharacterized protein n=1 Tax=Cnuella takakiae TaxID=1302690 RepID=A0A1M4Y128_9BACT|nr:hypothetical protein [Cnuella takakiae]OLY93010.1 hypothetical protein BUE76_14740 [Cnuella takakiae]SHE99388.1 hypothetical protein SAMN05444008_104113 [Cnuella takakiae]